MSELPFEYWNKLTSQFILISVFLGGFSIALTANLIISQTNDKLHNIILKVATTSSGGFLVTVFAMTNILMATTEGYPLEVTQDDLNTPRIIGILGYLVGVFSLFAIIGLSGWTKSRGTGIFTTVVSVITLVLFLVLVSS
ncbi:hypothetical protein [Fulvivirga ligni]|uniref:hypothetical protein n=1 Tax=Fulvivirga ligni TaxID=2904246 RepID=UPI001F2CEED3|nr:hypothetical protein [Fulvivirga ligni]UII24253.1 hypothetical protein LVD16_13610 [Fulvivirga ligni]